MSACTSLFLLPLDGRRSRNEKTRLLRRFNARRDRGCAQTHSLQRVRIGKKMYNPTEDIIFFAACVVSFFQERTFPLVSLSARSLSMTFRNSDDECEREREREIHVRSRSNARKDVIASFYALKMGGKDGERAPRAFEKVASLSMSCLTDSCFCGREKKKESLKKYSPPLFLFLTHSLTLSFFLSFLHVHISQGTKRLRVQIENRVHPRPGLANCPHLGKDVESWHVHREVQLFTRVARVPSRDFGQPSSSE